MVKAMKPGSVIVDLAAPAGGNVEGTVQDEKVVSDNGVTLLATLTLQAVWRSSVISLLN
jgi:NAD/NADP transhydrogenase alpha subunit